MKNPSNLLKSDLGSIKKFFKDLSFEYDFKVSAGLKVLWGLLKAKVDLSLSQDGFKAKA